MLADADLTHRYAVVAPIYWDLGWCGVLPVDPADKGGVPKGFTGYDGIDVTRENLEWFAKSKPDHNVGLRLPDTLIGIDVDAYDGKTGAQALAEAEKRWGKLPPTCRSTSRSDGVSGIRLFRVPPATKLVTKIEFPELGIGDIEIIQRHHRHVQAWPSLHCSTGKRYGWLAEIDMSDMGHPPAPSDPSELPSVWIEALKVQHNGAESGAEMPYNVSEALTEGQPSPRVMQRLTLALTDLVHNRHDNTRDHVLALLRLGKDDESGVGRALQILRDTFIAEVTKDGSRTLATAQGEFERYLTNDRAAKLLAEPSMPNLFAGRSLNNLADKFDFLEFPVPGTDPEPGTIFAENGSSNGPESGTAGNRTHSDQGGNRRDTGCRDPGTGPYTDIAAMLAGGVPDPPKPTVLKRRNGDALFYRGQVNCLFGDPEEGKTFVALAAVAEQLILGGSALFMDLDRNGAAAVVTRLLMMGAPRDALCDQSRFRHTDPDDRTAVLRVVQDTASWNPDVVVVDSVGELLPMFRASSNSADDYTIVKSAVLDSLAKTDAAVIVVDHLAKGFDSRATGPGGTMAKRRTLGGVSLRVVAKEKFAPNHGGRAVLLINKDRHGGLRAVCEPATGGKETVAGTFILRAPDAYLDPGELCWYVASPKPGDRSPDDEAEPELVAAIQAMDPPPTNAEDARDRLHVRKDRAVKAFREWKEQQSKTQEGEDNS